MVNCIANVTAKYETKITGRNPLKVFKLYVKELKRKWDNFPVKKKEIKKKVGQGRGRGSTRVRGRGKDVKE